MGRLAALLLIPVLFSASVASADTSPPTPKCTAPLKQTRFATQFQLDTYKAAVDLYRSCLDAFVKEQGREIEIHRQAAQDAIDQWDRFVGNEKKGPSGAPKDTGDRPGGEHQN